MDNLDLATPPVRALSRDTALERIAGFAQRFGETHLCLACHAAFPLALTPDLLYHIWASFTPQAPWTAIADVVLSSLFRDVGHELYEMDIAVRNLLLRELKEDERFGQRRFDELADFLIDYVAQQFYSDDPDERSLAQAQQWTALAYTRPGEVAKELASMLEGLSNKQNVADIVRMISLIESFAEPLVGLEPLMTYAHGVSAHLRGISISASFERQQAIPDRLELRTLLAALPILLPPNVRTLVEEAYDIAEKAHAGQVRASGEPYIQHCLSVALILAELRMPGPVIVAGLLHDTVEDSALTLEDIRHDFGDEVAKLVDGVTRLAQLPRVSKEGNTPIDRHTESLRKTFLAMSDDVRVVLIKLADRLHNMRTLHHLHPDKRERIARETLEIFAPLANRLGIWQMKSELEDLAFRYINPEKYREIAKHVEERRADHERIIERVVAGIRQALTEHNIAAEVFGRPKDIYSIYKKMERKGVGFDDVFDVRAVRVIVSDKPTCYYALGVIHSLWRPVPGQFDDYIATPKDNFYQSLHTAVLYDDGKTLEVQIRTPEMHENAEYGIAAHWRYKEGTRRDEAFEKRSQWLRSLMAWGQDVESAHGFVGALKQDVFEDRVYAFTPRGDIIDLPAGSTAIDFAYHIHTSVGDRCRGAKVNGKLVSLDYHLKTGDQVEILTTKQGGPSRDWLNPDLGLVKSLRAIQKIRQWFRTQDRELILAQGRELLEKELKRLGAEEVSRETLMRKFGFNKPEELLYALGTGDIHGRQVAAKVLEVEQVEEQERALPTVNPREEVHSDEISILGTQGLLTNMGRCCKPAPGDAIVGYITRGRGVTIHRRDCPNVLDTKEPDRFIKVTWGQARQPYPVLVRITAYDRDGLMRDIAAVVAEEKIDMTSLNVQTKNSIATFQITIEIRDVEVISRLLARIEQLPNVIEARRWKAK